ncbi:MAG: hypothetical protein FJ280_25760 [Planctomycetes bacterium]|nr:hypothetical protein [Planctomycetota bacterium]
MGSMFGEGEPQRGPWQTGEPLVDLNPGPAQPNEPPPGSKPRRKRLSEGGGRAKTQAETGAPQPQEQAKPRYRRSLAVSGTGLKEPPAEPPSQAEPPRARPRGSAAPPEKQEPQPRPGRPRIAIAPPAGSAPGLQDLGDPPHVSDDIPAAPIGGDEAGPSSRVDPDKVEQVVAELRAKQNFRRALAGGLGAAVVGAAIWAVITVAAHYQIGWMAVGVGFLVGGAVRTLGRGLDKSFGYLGAALSVFGCLLGNFLSLCAVIAGQEGLSLLTVLAHLGGNPIMIPVAMAATFHPMDLLFYGIAVYEGYRLSFRQITVAEIHRVVRPN